VASDEKAGKGINLMANREDEYYRQHYYGGHPPACTCVTCTEKRLAGIKNSRSGEKAWIYVLAGLGLVAAGWMVYLLAVPRIDTGIGMTFTAIYLGVFIWAISFFNRPWPIFKSSLLCLVVVLSAIIISVANW